MAEQEQEKMSVAPGIVKGGYEKPKKHKSNPTMQTAVQELPTAEKSVMYREYYATTLSFSTSMPANGEFSMEFITEVAPVAKTSVESPYKKLKREVKIEKTPDSNEKATVQEPVVIQIPPELTPPKVENIPSDMELAMNYMGTLPEQPTVSKVEPELNMDIPIVPQQEAPQVNVFGSINMMQNMPKPTEEKSPKVTKDEFKQTKPFMVVDKVEVRTVENESGETMYMIGREMCDHAKFETFKQEVSGKILAMDCKRLELHGVTYTKQKDGFYINDDNDVVTMDDLLNILHG